MSESDAADLVKRATAAALRALSGVPDLIVDYGSTASPVLGLAGRDRVRLSSSMAAGPADDLSRLRGEADALAAAERFHDAQLHQKLMRRASAAGAPQELLAPLEETRAFILSARDRKGVAVNLAARLDRDLADRVDAGGALRAALWKD